MSLDGYVAGPYQSSDDPVGVGGARLHEWMFATRTFCRRVLSRDGGDAGVDDELVARGFDGIGAWIIGRNMFGPIRGAWRGEQWRGWWGDAPPFGVPVFVLTHHPRKTLEMAGGTSFHFVTGGMHAALQMARDAARGEDVRIGGGADTIRQCLHERAIDEMHIALVPTVLGAGEHLFAGLDLRGLGYRCERLAGGERVAHHLVSRITT